jgi:hypothetical protein
VVEAIRNNGDLLVFRAHVWNANLRMSLSCQRGCSDNRSDCLVHLPVDVISDQTRTDRKLDRIRNRNALVLGRDRQQPHIHVPLRSTQLMQPNETAEQAVARQPTISFPNSIHFPFIRAGGRT